MVKKIGSGGKKIGKVKETETAAEVQTTGAVGSVTKVKSTQAIGGASSVGGIRSRRPTRTMTAEERSKLFQIIDEEADKLIAEGGIPEAQREVVRSAVKIAIDSGLIEEDKGKK